MKLFKQAMKYGSKVKQQVTHVIDNATGVVTTAAGTAMVASGNAFAALDTSDTSPIKLAIDAKVASGLDVGTMVIMGVLALAVIGLIVSYVRKN